MQDKSEKKKKEKYTKEEKKSIDLSDFIGNF